MRYLQIATQKLTRPSVIFLILANLVPLYGVIFLGWQIFPIMFLFWLENLIIGLINVLKMAAVELPGGTGRVAKFTAIAFFCLHYGLFTLVHGIFVFVVFGGYFGNPDTEPNDVFSGLQQLNLIWAVLALSASHLFSFIVNYIGKREYKQSNLNQLMGQPYTRVVILHLTIIFGAVPVMWLDSPVFGLVLLILLKMYVDVRAHIRQHDTVFGSLRIK